MAVIDATKIANPNESPILQQLAVGGQPIALALDTRTNLLYVADAENNQAASYDLGNVDPDNPKPVATYNVGEGFTDMALSPDGQTLALTSTATPAITLYNLRLIAVGLQGKTVVSLNSPPRALAFNARGDTLWIATQAGFSSYSLTSGAVVNIAESGGTTSVAFSPRLQLVYFGAGSGNIVYSYDAGTGQVNQIGTYAAVSGLALSADGTRLYATQNCSNCGLAVISTAQGQALTQTKFGTAPATRGKFASPGAISAANATFVGASGVQLSATLKATDRNNRSLTYTGITQPASGALALNPTGDFTYTPPTGYSGLQSFVWQAAATSGDGSPVNPASPPITETLAIRPVLSTIADQKADAGNTIGPLTFTISGSLPFTIRAASSQSGVVDPGNISFSDGCGTSSLSCSISMKTGSNDNGTA
ncbi:MAG: Ig-like domain-containing protein, partial [Gammaproteobacteria bacterium]